MIEMKAPRNPSSQIQSLGYDAETQTMAVHFVRGGIYHYFGVSPQTFEAMHAHESPGTYLHQNIKGKYKYEKR